MKSVCLPLVSLALLALGLCPPPARAAAPPLASFTLTEAFGVSHPDQIVDFDLAQPVEAGKCYLLGSDGKEVAYQILERGKRLALRTDLPAGATRTWELFSGRAPAAVPNGVQVAEQPGHYEVTNGLIGVRLPRSVRSFPDPAQALAPVQGVRYRDGTWSGTGPNYLATQAAAITSLQVRFLERGPLKVVVELTYRLERKELRANTDNSVLIPAGEGYYRSTVEVQAGQPSLLFEEDSDTDLEYSLNLYPGLEPTQARYRGHHATAKQYGYQDDGQVYAATNQRPPMDAFLDLGYDVPRRAFYAATPTTYRYMVVWDPWVFDSGWYYQVYNTEAGPGANLLGLFTGPASRAVGASASGAGIFTNPEPRRAGVTVAIRRLCADTRWFPRVRFAWGMFLGVKGQDLAPPREVQPVQRQMNLHSGVSLNKIHRYQLDYPDPPQGYGALYMPRASVQRMIQRLRTDREFFTYCYNADSYSRPLLDMWKDTSGEAARQAYGEVKEFGRFVVDMLVNGEGTYHPHYHYWQAGQAMMAKGLWVDSLLATDALNTKQRAQLKAIASAFGNVLWDDDFTPLFREHGLNLAQGPVQYLGYRHFYALYLSTQPTYQARAQEVEEQALAALPRIINESGAGVACTHYMPPYVASTLNTLMQLQMLGRDHFKTEPRLAKFAEFYMNFLTPPEPRFGGLRKYIATSDSSSESSELYGVLATAFRDADPQLSARLMGAWRAGGRKHDSRMGSTLLRIDDEAPGQDPALGSATFPGYYTVLRHGWGTPNETAVWLIDGEFYREHRHPDQGMVVIYALGAPLSVHWSSLYYPQVPGAYLNSTALLEDMIGVPWDQDSPPLNTGGGWRDSTSEAFLAFSTAGYTRAHYTAKGTPGTQGTQWTRAIYSLHPNEDYPAIVIRDSFAGEQAATPQVFTLNLMAEGPVGTPAGPVTPVLRSHPATAAVDPQQLPSAGPPQALTPAALNLFRFTGPQFGKAGESRGIDCDLYSFAPQPQQALLGNWAGNWHQEVRDLKESQHILRLRGTEGFQVLLLPYRQGACREDLQVTREGDALRLNAGDETTLLAPSFYAFYSPRRQILATFDAAPAAGAGLRAEGGPVEIVVQDGEITLTAHGAPGVRTIALPGQWEPQGGVTGLKPQGDRWLFDYAGPAPLSVKLGRP